MLSQFPLFPVYLLSLLLFQGPANDLLSEELRSAPADTTKVLALTDLAWEYLYNSADTSQQYCQMAYDLSREIDYPYGMGLAKETEGIILHNRLQLEASISSFLEAAQYYESAGAHSAFAGLYNNLGLLLLDTQDTLRALDYLERGLAYEELKGDTSDILISKINIYVLYSANGQLERAETGFRSILPTAKSIGNLHLEQVITSNLAVIDQRRGNYAAAVEKLTQFLSSGADSIKHNQLFISVTTTLAEILLRLDRPKAARDYLQQARRRMEACGDRRYLLDILAGEVALAEALGAPTAQIDKMNRYHAVKDSVAEADNLQQVAALNANYAFLRQREEIAQLNLAKALETQRLHRERTLFGGGILIFLVLGWLAYHAYRRKLQEEKVLRAQQALELRHKSQQLHTFTNHLAERNQRIQELETAFSEQDSTRQQLTAQLSTQAILTEEDWCQFQQLFHEVHPDFLPKMRRDAIGFTEGELRLAALIHLGLDRQTIANILGISPESVRKNFYRLEKKVALKKEDSLAGYLSRYQVA